MTRKNRLQRTVLRYGAPVLLTGAAYALTARYIDLERSPMLLLFLAAVLLSAYVGSWQSGLLATGLSVAMVAVFLMAPYGSARIKEQDDLVRLGTLAAVGLVGTFTVGRLRVLLERERLLRLLVETSPTLTLLTDGEGRIEVFNRHCEEVTGYRREEVVGKTIVEVFILPEWVPVLQKRFTDLDAPEVRMPHRNPWRTKSGTTRMIEWRCRPVQRRNQAPLVLAIGTDVTEAMREEELQREAERLGARAELINELAHELNNPLQALTNLLALTEHSDCGASAEQVAAIMEQVARMTELSRRILTASAQAPALLGGAGTSSGPDGGRPQSSLPAD